MAPKIDSPTLDNLAINIQEVRKEKKWSQKDLARNLGVSTAFVNHLEHGNRHPSLDTLFRMAKVLGVSVDRLIRTPKKRKKK